MVNLSSTIFSLLQLPEQSHTDLSLFPFWFRPSTHLEAQDDSPDEAQHQAVIAINNVMRPHVLQMHTLLLEKLQGFVHILQAVNSHAPFGGLRLQDKFKVLHIKGTFSIS